MQFSKDEYAELFLCTDFVTATHHKLVGNTTADSLTRFNSKIRLITREENEAIEIYPSETENTETKAFTIEYLFNHVIPNEICDVNIDVSKITTLELSNCHLTDVPTACNKLNLKYLGLSHNNLEHVPSCLYNGLKHLESLDLSYNLIQNFDLEPDCLPYLKKIKLNSNKFVNAPKWFLMFRCTSVEEFDYSNNKAKTYKYMKNSFNLNLFKLKKLQLISSCLIDDDFNLLKCFRQMRYLDISNDMLSYINKFDDLDKLFVKPKWKELNVLKLNGLYLSIFPEGIAWIESLKELYVSNNNLSWLPDGIEFLVNLEILVISNNSIVSVPKCLASMEKLTVLQAFNNCIDGVPDFSSMSNLKTLDLYNNSLDMISFNVNAVNYIDLEGNYCDTREFHNLSLYEEKRNNLRKKYSIEDRYDGPKTKEPEDLTDSCSELDLHYDDANDTNSIAFGTFDDDDDENWDLPHKTNKVHSDIDTEDDMWQGEETNTCLKSTCVSEKVYVSEDDWMFEDCDAS